MKFLLNVIDSRTGYATSQEMADITAFNNGVRDQGNFVLAAGLSAPEESRVFDANGSEEPTPERVGASTDFASSSAPHPYVSGFWILECDDAESAAQLASQAARACARRVELRPFLD